MPRELVPSLDACLETLAYEIAGAHIRDEGLDEIMTDADQGAVFIATGSEHEFGITVFGFTDNV